MILTEFTPFISTIFGKKLWLRLKRKEDKKKKSRKISEERMSLCISESKTLACEATVETHTKFFSQTLQHGQDSPGQDGV